MPAITAVTAPWMIATLLGAAGPPAASPPMVLWVIGDAHVAPLSANGEPGPPLRVDVLDPLSPGERLALDEEARVWLLVAPCRLARLVGPEAFLITEEEVVSESSGAAPLVEIAGCPLGGPRRGAPFQADPAVLPSAAAPRLLTPVETTVATRRPLLRWEALDAGTASAAAGAAEPRGVAEGPAARPRYALDLWRLEADGSVTSIERWVGLTQHELRAHMPLDGGRYFLWRVSLVGAPGAVSEAWFRVPDAAELDEVQASLESLERGLRSGDDAAAEEAALTVVRASSLEHLGRLDGAEAAWRALAASRPEGEAISRRLRRLEHRSLVEPRRSLRLPLPFGTRLEEPEGP